MSGGVPPHRLYPRREYSVFKENQRLVLHTETVVQDWWNHMDGF